MREVTFQLDVSIGNGCKYRLVERKTIREKDLLAPGQFDALVNYLKHFDCEYRVVKVTKHPIEGVATFEVD